MSNDSIRLHPKYGLNVALDHCAWCGEPSGVAMFGASVKEDMQYKKVCTSEEPCQKCQENMAQGITVASMREENGKLVRNGPWAVIKLEAFEAHHDWLPEEYYQDAQRTRRLAVDAQVFGMLFGDGTEEGDE